MYTGFVSIALLVELLFSWDLGVDCVLLYHATGGQHTPTRHAQPLPCVTSTMILGTNGFICLTLPRLFLAVPRFLQPNSNSTVLTSHTLLARNQAHQDRVTQAAPTNLVTLV